MLETRRVRHDHIRFYLVRILQMEYLTLDIIADDTAHTAQKHDDEFRVIIPVYFEYRIPQAVATP